MNDIDLHNEQKMKDTPLVSVIMATYNERPKDVSVAISSIVNQTYKNIELLIYDDSTNQQTKDAIDYFSRDPRVRINRYGNRIGFVSALNRGLEDASGEYIARMDGDDYSYPRRIEIEVMFLENHPKISIISGQVDIMDDDGDVMSHRSFPLSGWRLWLFSCIRNPISHPAVMMRRDIIDKGFRYNEQLKMSEDLDLWLRLINNGYLIGNVSDTLIKFRVQSNFLDKRVGMEQRIYMAKVRKANFCLRHPIHGAISAIAGWLFMHVPASSIKSLYNKENQE